MVKYFKDMDGLILVGDRPAWFKGFHLQHSDIDKRKEYSVYKKLLTAKQYIYPETKLLLCHDDIFALQPFDSFLPNYYRGTCKEAIQWTKERRFKDMLLSCPPDWLHFEVHAPMVIDTSLIEDEDSDFLLKTTYANRNHLPGIDIADCKLRGELNTTEIRQRIKGRPFFSTQDNMEGYVLKVANQLYPEKSKFEV